MRRALPKCRLKANWGAACASALWPPCLTFILGTAVQGVSMPRMECGKWPSGVPASRWLGGVLAVALMAAPAWAVLGQQVQSVLVDRARVAGRLRQIRATGYTIQQISSGQPGRGTVIREYVSPSGMVFGVSWHGPRIPNLRALLGAYFTRFQKAAAQPRRVRGPLRIQSGDLVVESAGHMRAFYGRAFVTKLIPHNVSAAVVR